MEGLHTHESGAYRLPAGERDTTFADFTASLTLPLVRLAGTAGDRMLNSTILEAIELVVGVG